MSLTLIPSSWDIVGGGYEVDVEVDVYKRERGVWFKRRKEYGQENSAVVLDQFGKKELN